MAKGGAVDSDSSDLNLADLGCDEHVSDRKAEGESQVAKGDAGGHFSGAIGFVSIQLHIHGGDAFHVLVSGGDLKASKRLELQVDIKWDVGTVVVLNTSENKFHGGV